MESAIQYKLYTFYRVLSDLISIYLTDKTRTGIIQILKNAIADIEMK